MIRTEIITKLTTIFRSTFNSETIVLVDDMTADDIDNWDSMMFLNLITDVEDDFGIKFKLRELDKLKNVGVIIDLVEEKVNKK